MINYTGGFTDACGKQGLTTTPVKIVSENLDRNLLCIMNIGSVDVIMAETAALCVDADARFQIPANGFLNLDAMGQWRGELYAATLSGTTDIRITEA